MLLTEEVEVTWGNNKKIYEPKGYVYSRKGTKFMVKIKDLVLGSNLKVDVQCDYCLEEGIETISSVIYKNYIRSLKNSDLVNKDACKKCRSKKLVNVIFTKYNVKSVLSLPKIQEKISNTNIIRYGTSNVFDNSSSIRVDIYQSILIKYGFLSYMQTKKFIESHTGENNNNWKGGISSENQKIRNSSEYKEWRKSVFKRDNYTCQVCGKRGGNLQVHHLESFAGSPELRLNIDNGITVCEEHHKSNIKGSFHNVYGYNGNTKEQFIQYTNNIKNNHLNILCTQI